LGAVLYEVLTGTTPEPDQLYLAPEALILSMFFTGALQKDPPYRSSALNGLALLEQFGNYR